MKKINIIATGGTIEKDYVESNGRVDNIKENLHNMLGRLRLPGLEISVCRILNKDSLDMTQEDRLLILENTVRLLKDQAPILITHGTDTMAITGNYLRAHLEKLKVPVVLTGAMVPYGFERSDALQNLTESLALLQHLKPDVWIVFHSKAIPAINACKDRINNTFTTCTE